MARRTFADMDAELLLRLANRTDVTSAMREQFINDSYLRIANEFDHKELQVTASETLLAAASSLTPVASDIWWIDFVKDTTNGKDIQFTDVEDVEQYLVSTGNPNKFYWHGGVMYFDAAPASNLALKLWYTKKPTRLSGTDNSALDEVFDPVIVMFAQALGFQTVRDMRESHIAEVQANNYVARMRLPRRQVKLNDNRAGLQVRRR
jgi:hypothetical protein